MPENQAQMERLHHVAYRTQVSAGNPATTSGVRGQRGDAGKWHHFDRGSDAPCKGMAFCLQTDAAW